MLPTSASKDKLDKCRNKNKISKISVVAAQSDVQDGGPEGGGNFQNIPGITFIQMITCAKEP